MRVGRSQFEHDVLAEVNAASRDGDWERGLSKCRLARTVAAANMVSQACATLAQSAVAAMKADLATLDPDAPARADLCVDLARYGELLPAAEQQQALGLCEGGRPELVP